MKIYCSKCGVEIIGSHRCADYPDNSTIQENKKEQHVFAATSGENIYISPTDNRFVIF